MVQFVWYLDKERTYGIEILSFARVLNMGHFMEKSCRKCAPKTSPRPPFYFGKQSKTAIGCKKFF